MADASKRAQAPRPSSGAGSLRVGRLTKPHGLKGGVKIEMFTDNPELRFYPGAKFYLQVPEDSSWFAKIIELREIRWFNDAPVGFFKEVPDRTAAESIVRAILWIDEKAVAEGIEDNAWYDHELVGLDVVRPLEDGTSEKLGTVAEVQHFPAQDLLAVNTDNGIVLVPFVESIVPSVDLEVGVVTVTPPIGLFGEGAIEARGDDSSDEAASSNGAGSGDNASQEAEEGEGTR